MRFAIIPVFAMAILSTQPAQAEHRTVGSVEFRVGKTDLPLYPRGGGPDRKWELDGILAIDSPHWEFRLQPTLIGGSIIDNPDQFRFDVSADYKLPLGFRAIASHDDAYALNHEIVPDSAARRPNSSVNAWWLGGAWQTGNYAHGGRIALRRSVAGNVPVWYGAPSIPYAQIAIDARAWKQRCDGVTYYTANTIFFGRHGTQLSLRGGLDRRVIRELHLGFRGELHINDGTQSFRDRGALFLIARIPF